MSIITSEYKDWIGELKQRIRQSQIKAAVKVNTELLQLYWKLGGEIVEKQQNAQWGDGFLKQLSADLMTEFPEMKGFSLRNLERIRNWYLFYYEHYTITAQAVPQFGNANRKRVVGKIDAVTTKQPASQLGNGIRAQVVPQLAESFFSVPWLPHAP